MRLGSRHPYKVKRRIKMRTGLNRGKWGILFWNIIYCISRWVVYWLIFLGTGFAVLTLGMIDPDNTPFFTICEWWEDYVMHPSARKAERSPW